MIEGTIFPGAGGSTVKSVHKSDSNSITETWTPYTQPWKDISMVGWFSDHEFITSHGRGEYLNDCRTRGSSNLFHIPEIDCYAILDQTARNRKQITIVKWTDEPQTLKSKLKAAVVTLWPRKQEELFGSFSDVLTSPNHRWRAWIMIYNGVGSLLDTYTYVVWVQNLHTGIIRCIGTLIAKSLEINTMLFYLDWLPNSQQVSLIASDTVWVSGSVLR